VTSDRKKNPGKKLLEKKTGIQKLFPVGDFFIISQFFPPKIPIVRRNQFSLMSLQIFDSQMTCRTQRLNLLGASHYLIDLLGNFFKASNVANAYLGFKVPCCEIVLFWKVD